jgi:hypothetical protein
MFASARITQKDISADYLPEIAVSEPMKESRTYFGPWLDILRKTKARCYRCPATVGLEVANQGYRSC